MKEVCCPICKGKGTIPANLLTSQSIDFLHDLLKTQEFGAFLGWAQLKWRSEPDRTVAQTMHRELEVAAKGIEASFQEKLKSRDEEHQKWLQGFLERLDLKEKAKKQMIADMKEQWKKHIDESRNNHLEADEKLVTILDRLDLRSKIAAKGFKFEEKAMEQLELDWPIWEFEPTQDSKLGDCIAKPKVKNGNGDYEPTPSQILLEFTTEQRVGTQKIRQLTGSMKRRNISFGVIITEKAEQIMKRYYPYRFQEGRIAIVPFELRNVALSNFEAIITELHRSGKKPQEINWEHITTILNEILLEEESLAKDIMKIGNNLISQSNALKTKLTNRLEDHTEKAAQRLRNEIMRKQCAEEALIDRF